VEQATHEVVLLDDYDIRHRSGLVTTGKRRRERILGGRRCKRISQITACNRVDGLLA